MFLLFVGNISVSIKPFSISIPFWHRSVGLILVIIGFILYNVGEQTSEYKRGWDDCIKAVENCIKTTQKKMYERHYVSGFPDRATGANSER